MKNISLFKKTLLAASIATLTACSGGGSSTPATTTGTTSGVITNFGSVYVNGVKYETDTASVSIDGVSSLEGNLAVGDTVVIQGTVNANGTTGTATSISSVDELEGYVLDISDYTNGVGSINVMGQTVNISLDTVIDTAVISINDIVEVHGYSDGNGTIAATRIETKSDANDVEIKGIVSALDTATLTFMIGNKLTVDYTGANEYPATLADGLYVEVKNVMNAIPTGDITNGFIMFASKVEIEEDGDMDIDGDEGDEIKVQGVVSDITDSSFLFNGSLVTFDSLEDDDFDTSTLVDGMMITVEGYIDANGDFIVKEIEEDYGSDNEMKGTVSDITDTTITVTDTNGAVMTFTVDNNTRMMDEQNLDQMTPIRKFSLEKISIDDYVEVEYSDNDITIATELTCENNPASM